MGKGLISNTTLLIRMEEHMDLESNLQKEKVERNISEDRYKLLHSQIKTWERIANLKQKLEMKLMKMEQNALSDMRAFVGMEMLNIRKREKGTHAGPAKILSFEENDLLLQLEHTISELGTIQLINAPDDEDDSSSTSSEETVTPESETSTIKSSTFSHTELVLKKKHVLSSDGSTSGVSSGYARVDGKYGSASSSQSGMVEIGHYIEVGTIKRKSKRRTSILNQAGGEVLSQHSSSDKTDGKLTPQNTTLTETETEVDEYKPILFTIIKDHRIIVLSKAKQQIGLHRSDFAAIDSVDVIGPLGICYHSKYDIIAVLSRTNNSNRVVLVNAYHGSLEVKDEVNIACQGRALCLTYSQTKLYIGCNENHIHVIDDDWQELPHIPHAALRRGLVSIAYNEDVFCLLEDDGSVTYIDSQGRFLSKDSISAVSVGFAGSTPLVLCREAAQMCVIEANPRENESETTDVVEKVRRIKTDLPDAHDMHISNDGQEITILFGGEDTFLAMQKFNFSMLD